MRSSVANDRLGEPCGEIYGRGYPSGRLYGDASVIQLPNSFLADNRNLASPTQNGAATYSAEQHKQRQCDALARLIGQILPNGAKALAADLIAEFGTLASVLNESPEALRRVIRKRENVIQLLSAAWGAVTEGYRSEIASAPITGTDQKLIDYLVADMGFRKNETLRVLFLDNSNRLIGDENIAEGTVRQLQFYPRRIFKRAFELNASALIIAHNHPGGAAAPSKSDIAATHSIIALSASLDLTVHDHIIIAGQKWSSMKAAGLM